MLTAKQSPFSLKKTGPGNVFQTILTPTYSALKKLNFRPKWDLNPRPRNGLSAALPLSYKAKKEKKWMLCRSLFSCILLIQNHTANGDDSWFLCSTWYMQLAKTCSVTLFLTVTRTDIYIYGCNFYANRVNSCMIRAWLKLRGIRIKRTGVVIGILKRTPKRLPRFCFVAVAWIFFS